MHSFTYLMWKRVAERGGFNFQPSEELIRSLGMAILKLPATLSVGGQDFRLPIKYAQFKDFSSLDSFTHDSVAANVELDCSNFELPEDWYLQPLVLKISDFSFDKFQRWEIVRVFRGSTLIRLITQGFNEAHR